MSRVLEIGSGLAVVAVVMGIITAVAACRGDASPQPPAQTPVPGTATRAPCPTGAEQRYLGQVANIMADVGPALGATGVLFLQAAADLALLSDDAWRTAVRLELATLRASAAEFRELRAPTPGTRAIERTLDALAQELEAAVTNTALALDTFETAAIERATANMERVGELATEGLAATAALHAGAGDGACRGAPHPR